MRVVIVGTGYVGLVSGVCLASRGHNVVCVDINPSIVARLNAGEPPIHERGLPELLNDVQRSGLFKATVDLYGALEGVDLVVLAVGTPSEDGVIDLQYVGSVCREIGEYIGGSARHISVVVKSTVVPGTTDTFVRQELERSSGKKLGAFGLGMNPEFLREGEAIEDFMNPDRIVLGSEDAKTLERLEELYYSWDVDKMRVNCRTAEMIKYANNALLATQISAVNELANLAASLGGVDILDVMGGVHLDKRWNPIVNGRRAEPMILSYLMPGCGFGGSCFPKDVQALRSQGVSQGLPMLMLNAVLEVNEEQPRQVVDVLKRHVGSLAERKLLVLGLAFKPETDDVRESASLKIVKLLIGEGAVISAHDPIAAGNFADAMGELGAELQFVRNWQDEIVDAEIILVLTKWNEYHDLIRCNLSGKIIFDARRMFEAGELSGSSYLSIGRTMQ